MKSGSVTIYIGVGCDKAIAFVWKTQGLLKFGNLEVGKKFGNLDRTRWGNSDEGGPEWEIIWGGCGEELGLRVGQICPRQTEFGQSLEFD